ncbi:hypothetical protein [Georgfuchsia toluolica]|uniref:hypothetical protein n=1 Tax=Georgfuchsia toluolica TaxID=424218 RepID=UPI003CCE72D2
MLCENLLPPIEEAIAAAQAEAVALAHEGRQSIQFWPLGVLVRRLAGEYLVHLNLFKLAFWVLVEALTRT